MYNTFNIYIDSRETDVMAGCEELKQSSTLYLDATRGDQPENLFNNEAVTCTVEL